MRVKKKKAYNMCTYRTEEPLLIFFQLTLLHANFSKRLPVFLQAVETTVADRPIECKWKSYKSLNSDDDENDSSAT